MEYIQKIVSHTYLNEIPQSAAVEVPIDFVAWARSIESSSSGNPATYVSIPVGQVTKRALKKFSVTLYGMQVMKHNSNQCELRGVIYMYHSRNDPCRAAHARVRILVNTNTGTGRLIRGRIVIEQ